MPRGTELSREDDCGLDDDWDREDVPDAIRRRLKAIVSVEVAQVWERSG